MGPNNKSRNRETNRTNRTSMRLKRIIVDRVLHKVQNYEYFELRGVDIGGEWFDMDKLCFASFSKPFKPITQGFELVHLDWDPENNSFSNLEVMSLEKAKEHMAVKGWEFIPGVEEAGEPRWRRKV